MNEVFISGLKEWRDKLRKEVEEMEVKRAGRKEGGVFHTALTQQIEMRNETIDSVSLQIEKAERRLEKINGV